jgi:hypothetical protein
VRRLAGLGFDNVYHKCEDFYQVTKEGQTPEFDVLVTNPPYSAEHFEKLLDFALSYGKPYALLMPNFVYTKPYFEDKVRHFCQSKLDIDKSVWFLVRYGGRYEYLPPDWVAQQAGGSTSVDKAKATTAPFPSFWYVGGFDYAPCSRKSLLAALQAQGRKIVRNARDPVYVVHQKHPEMFKHKLLLCLSKQALPEEVRGELDKTRKRPNSKSRKRMKKRLLA